MVRALPGAYTSRVIQRAALYVRVSKDEQHTDNQVPELRRMAEARGFEPVVYEEIESGAKRRPVLDRLVADAKRGTFRAVFVWALDRLGRGGAAEACRLVEEFDRLKVGVISARESWLDTSPDNPMRELLIAITATFAKMERTRLIERTRAGLDRARRLGKRLGRPPASPILVRAAADLVAAGMPVAEAARSKGVKRSTLRRFIAKVAENPGQNLGETRPIAAS